MNTKIYFENLAATATESELTDLFSPFGNIVGIKMAVDHASERPCTFGFVTMVTPEGARAAVEFLNGKSVGTHILVVTEACPPERHITPRKVDRNPRRRSSHLF